METVRVIGESMSDRFFELKDIMDSDVLNKRGIHRYYFETVDSTNEEARRYADNGGSTPVVFLAKCQTRGRGRMGRSFYSPQGTGLYMTLLIDVSGDKPTSVVKLTSGSAVAASLSIEAVTGVKTAIKWVNDLYLEEKKVCGILAESFFCGEKRYVCIGIGVNLSTEDFPEELDGIAGSVGVSEDVRGALAEELSVNLMDLYDRIKNGDLSYMSEYRSRSAVLGKTVDYFINGELYEGEAVRIEDDGSLVILRRDGNTDRLCSGEISLKIRK